MAMVGCQSGLCHTQWNALNCSNRAGRKVWNRCNINNSIHFRKTKSRWSRLREGKSWGCSVKRVLQTHANSKADDSMPFEMSLESALEVLGVREGASFEEIMRAKNSILDSNRDNQELAAQVEAAYDTLLMKSLMQRRAGKVIDNSIRFADVKLVGNSGIGGMPEWLKNFLKNAPVSVEVPSANDLGIQTGVYGALVAWTLVNGLSYPAEGQFSSGGADVPGLILATGFGASLYFLRKKNVKLGKAAVITVGGLVVGAVIGGVVESWLQVDIVPLFGIRSPAVVVSEFVLLSQWLSSLYFR